MIEFDNIECNPKINKKKTVNWLNNVISEENKTCGNIVYVYCIVYYIVLSPLRFKGIPVIFLNSFIKL